MTGTTCCPRRPREVREAGEDIGDNRNDIGEVREVGEDLGDDEEDIEEVREDLRDDGDDGEDIGEVGEDIGDNVFPIYPDILGKTCLPHLPWHFGEDRSSLSSSRCRGRHVFPVFA